jgi:hypothetical protein
MMTRAHVARRLGKSIATVRRLEGTELHPKVDDRGVNQFDPNEVERLATGGFGTSSRRPDSTPNSRAFLALSEGDDDRREADLENARLAAGEYKQALDLERERSSAQQRTVQQLEDENDELREAVRACASLVLNSLDQSQLSDLGEDGIEALEQLIQLCG